MKRLLSLLLLLCTTSVFAGQDPLSWTVNPSSGLPANTSVGSTYAITYRITNNLPMAVPLTVDSQHTGGTYTITNGCNKTLAAKGQGVNTCSVHISLQPTKTGSHTFQLILSYHKNRVPLTKLVTNTTSNQTSTKLDGRVTTPLPPITYIGLNYPVSFSYLNNGQTAVTATAVNVSGFTATTNTCTTPLAPGAVCQISGTFTPSIYNINTLSTNYVYSGGSSLLSTQTDVEANDAPCPQIEGKAVLPLPMSTYVYTDNVVKYTFTNVCPTSTTLGIATLTTNGTATLTKGNDTCSNATLAAGASCEVNVSVVPTVAAANLSVRASLPYNANQLTASVISSEAVSALANQATTHTVMFVNQCDQTVWYSFQNNAGGSTNKSPDPTPAGQRTFADYQLNAQLQGAAPFVKVLAVNEYINGAIYGRTQCNTSTGVCATANCPVIAGTGTCQTSIGANNPTTIFEANMTSLAATDGVYDISIINGFNIPGQIKSLAPLSSDAFGCGQSAGATIQPTGSSLGACPWSFTTPSTIAPDTAANYIWVSSGTTNGCGACGANEYCGTAYSADGGQAPIYQHCGTFLGYWTLADYVGYSASSQWGLNGVGANLYNAYNMGTVLPNGPLGSYGTVGGTAATYAALYACTPTSNNSLDSGYGSGTPANPLPNTNVCGCYDWNQSGSAAPTAQASQCTGYNSDWITNVYPRILWLKQACPTAYTYQFDDKSVSFTCNVPAQKTSYQITFCPGGKTGRPGT